VSLRRVLLLVAPLRISLEDPPPDRHDEACVLGYVDEGPGSNDPLGRVVPAKRCLGPDDPSSPEVDERLIRVAEGATAGLRL
jgi:hypothetical protein